MLDKYGVEIKELVLGHIRTYIRYFNTQEEALEFCDRYRGLIFIECNYLGPSN